MRRLDRPASSHTASPQPRAQPQQLSPVLRQPAPQGSPAAILAHGIRGRMESVLRGVPGKLAQAEQSTHFLTGGQQQRLRASSPEMQQLLIQRFQQENQGRLLGMRSQAAAVNRPFSTQETRENVEQAALALRGSVEQMFASFERHASALPLDPFEKAQVMKQLMIERDRAFQGLDANLGQLTRSDANFKDIDMAWRSLTHALGMSGDYMAIELLRRTPPESQAMVKAEFQMLQDAQRVAEYNLLSRALQPSGPEDFSKVPPGRLPWTPEKLNPAHAHRLMTHLEQGIYQQFEMRKHLANTLPPEHREAALFDAEVQRDRMLVSAYRHVLRRLENPQKPPQPPPAS